MKQDYCLYNPENYQYHVGPRQYLWVQNGTMPIWYKVAYSSAYLYCLLQKNGGASLVYQLGVIYLFVVIMEGGPLYLQFYSDLFSFSISFTVSIIWINQTMKRNGFSQSPKLVWILNGNVPPKKSLCSAFLGNFRKRMIQTIDPFLEKPEKSVVNPNKYPLVNIPKTIENGHRNSWFIH